jgi:hypothetical protein
MDLNDRSAPIPLKKSPWGDERKFLEPLMRFTCGDVRDHRRHKSITRFSAPVIRSGQEPTAADRGAGERK